jgi:transcriptional regulator with XRE-family HTH domain
MNAIVGNNLKRLREFNNFSQEQVAVFIGINRSTYSNYELGEREAPFEILEEVSHLYGCDLYVLFEESEEVFNEALVCTFRVDKLSNSDLQEIAGFKDIVKSYLKISRLLES